MEEQFTEVLPYSELTKIYSPEKIIYPLLLRTTEWRDFRKAILKRDSYQCQVCKNHATEMSDGFSFVALVTQSANVWLDGIKEEVVSETPTRQNRYYQLQIHHRYYVKRKLPWEYDTKALQTVCQYCHKEIHQKRPTPVYELNGEVNYEYTVECRKCEGKGNIPRYSHISNGVCFACMGDGFIGVY